MAVPDFIQARLASFVGQNIDCVGAQMEEIAHHCGFWFRWLEPAQKVAPDKIFHRVNVHVIKRHKITRITVG